MSPSIAAPTCRSCGAALEHVVVDLGRQPLSNAYLLPEHVAHEQLHPLVARFCASCALVQVDDVVTPGDIFEDYAYFSSYADSWVEHARRFTETAIERRGLDRSSFVAEVASNDGYLLHHFVERGVPVLGIEPAKNVAAVAIERGVPTDVGFFGTARAAAIVAERGRADLVVGNNVLAHVPDLNDFISGLAQLVADDGVVSIEVPHLLRLVEGVQFDTIYHEHYSYFSLIAASRALERHGLRVIDVDELTTHGGSLRIWASRSPEAPSAAVERVLAQERAARLDRIEGFDGFAESAARCRDGLVSFLGDAADRGQRVAAYGAAAKGNTLLNYAGVGPGAVAYVVDRNPHKQGLLLPGSHVPIMAPEHLLDDRPDHVLILPWNLRDEIVEQMAEVRSWGGRFVVAVPAIEVLP